MDYYNKKYVGLYNGTARRGNPKELDKIISFCQEKRIELIEVKKKDDVKGTLLELKFNGIQIIFVIGGDGTIRNLIDGIVNSSEFSFKVVILGGGTMNAIAYKIGWSNSPYKNFIRFLSEYDPEIFGKKSLKSKNKLREFHFSPLKIVQGNIAHYGSYLFFGPPAKVIANVYDRNHSVAKGVWVVLISLFAALFGFPRQYKKLYQSMPINFIKVGEKQISQKKISLFGVSVFRRLLCANLNGIGIPLIVPFKGNQTNDQFFLISYDLPFWQIPLLLFFIIIGLFPRRSNNLLLNQPTKSAVLILPNEEIAVIDGESRIFLAEKEIHISLLPRQIIFLCP